MVRAFGTSTPIRNPQQSGCTPYASRGSLPQEMFEGCGHVEPQPNLAKRVECVELAPAFGPSRTIRKRQQAGRTPCASRGSLPQEMFEGCGHVEPQPNFAKRMEFV